MNLKRIISGLIGFPIVVLIFLLGNKYVIDIAVTILAVISVHEYTHCFKTSNKANPISWISYLSCALILAINIVQNEYILPIVGVYIPFVILALFLHIIITDLKTTVLDVAVTCFGIIYLVLFYSFIPMVYGMENGKFFVWYTILSAWGTDIFAYAVGRRIGKHKFSQISPNKSIEGCVAGTVGAIILTLIYTVILNKCFNYNINYIIISVIALVLSLVGQIGDFAASSIKRFTGVKDYSNLIPGHGGILDRFDSLLFIAPFAYFLLMLI